jgi:hypothetical protein
LKKVFLALIALAPSSAVAAADTNAMLSPYQYNMMEPYLNKTMRGKLKPKDSEYSVSSNQAMARTMTNSARTPLSNYARPTAGDAKSARRVVARSASAPQAQAQARSARPVANGAGAANTANTARAAVAPAVSARRVVSRGRSASASTAREVGMTTTPGAAAATYVQAAQTTGDITMAQCLSGYSECMDNYCHRQNTKYDRCYCSAKLQQLDSEYKPAIDELIKKIAILKNGGEIADGMTQEEINEYWNGMFGATGSNSMEDLDNALNIDWAGTESSVRGQNAFVAGDNYCRQHLTGCFYMAENMKSMYRTTIGQDCKKYETNLKKLKYAAERAVDSLQ